MATQTERGKAFEYACLKALHSALQETQEVSIEETSAYFIAKNFYDHLDCKMVVNLDKAANAAVKILCRLEPQLLFEHDSIPLFVSIQEDAKGITGDVRDILCIRKQNDWEIGISCKHNHSAVKHSRLSQTIDFGNQWFGKHCSTDYFEQIKPVFDYLVDLKSTNCKWSDVHDKESSVYVPILNAFIKELKNLDALYPNEIPSELLKYLIGKNDFYKVITADSRKVTKIQAFNINGTLNKQANRERAITRIPGLNLPTRFLDISFKSNSKNTIIISCDNGWVLSFRIHSAKSTVEPSLKFDIQLKGIPESLYSQTEPW